MNSLDRRFLPVLPDALQGLAELALDLRWSWHHAADQLWRRLNPGLWSLTHNPWLVLQAASERKLEDLARDETFRETLSSLLTTDRHSHEAPAWFQHAHPDSPLSCVAYFSMEFGLSEALPLYSGGLGLLAGDHLKTASDLGVPVVAVGILYQYGYFRQALEADGSQVALYPTNNLSELPIMPVRDASGDWLRLEFKLPGYSIWLRVWEARLGRVSLYLLDTNDPANRAVDRCITTELYGGGPEQRLQQEMLLGIGGWRVLRALGIEPQVCHLNEGHAALAVVERARSFMEDHGVSFEVALSVTRGGNLFTTHTPVEAGFDRFQPELIRRYLCRYVEALGISGAEFLALGRSEADNVAEPFNMAHLAVRGSAAVNGVSRLHGEVSRSIFAPLFPGWPTQEVPVGHVTNGVHVPSWDSAEADALWTEACGKERWIGDLAGLEERFARVSDEALWDLRMQSRRKLVSYARHYHARQLGADGGRTSEEVEAEAQRLFDPNVLTIGFARRFATYKRPNLLLRNPERLARMLTDVDRPVQLVIAGKAHPQDWSGQEMVKAWVQFTLRPELRDRAIFISDYDMLLAERLVQGVDVWLNTPRRPWEASGTSGMKVLVNGGLNLSELDGWWAEAYSPEVGWAIGDGQEHADIAVWDEQEAEQLYSLLENEVIPEFYQRDEEGIPRAWVARMRASMARLTPLFSTNRMVRDYTERYYLACAERYRERSAKRGALGEELTRWRHRLVERWSAIHFGEVHWEVEEESYRFKAPVYLGEVGSESVAVELYASDGNGRDLMLCPMVPDHALTGAANGYLYVGQAPADRPAADYSVRVIPRHAHAEVPLENGLIRWQRVT